MANIKRTILLAVAATALFSAVAASSALANSETPYFVIAGHSPIIETPFTGSSTGVVEITLSGGDLILCGPTTLSGEFGAASGTGKHPTFTQKVQKVVITFKNCRGVFSGNECKLGNKGTVTSETLKGTLGIIDESTHPAGLKLEGQAGGNEPLFATFKCETAFEHTTRLTGHLIGRMEAALNTPFLHVNLHWTKTANKQTVQGFEGGPTKEYLTTEFVEFEKKVIEAKEVGLEATDELTSFVNKEGKGVTLEIIQ